MIPRALARDILITRDTVLIAVTRTNDPRFLDVTIMLARQGNARHTEAARRLLADCDLIRCQRLHTDHAGRALLFAAEGTPDAEEC